MEQHPVHVIKRGILLIVTHVRVDIKNLVQMDILLQLLRHVVQVVVVRLLGHVTSVVIVVTNIPVMELDIAGVAVLRVAVSIHHVLVPVGILGMVVVV